MLLRLGRKKARHVILIEFFGNISAKFEFETFFLAQTVSKKDFVSYFV